MPATEQTWRSQKGMHVIFAISGVVLLASTVWMFQADHDRQWKGFQKTARRIELTGIQWRQLQASSDDLLRERQAKQKELDAERAAQCASYITSAAYHIYMCVCMYVCVCVYI